MRRAATVVLVAGFFACRSGTDSASLADASGSGAASTASTPTPSRAVEAPAVAKARTVRVAWDEGTVTARLQALAMTEASYAKRDVYSWTTRAQIDALRTSGKLLVAKSTDGAKSPFVWLLESLARQPGDTGALATILTTDTRFERRRYAWTAAYATVLGLLDKRYGDELVHVKLRPDAVYLSLDPSRVPALSATDLEGKPVTLAGLVADPSRIAAIYHVRKGLDVPSPFREIVLVNEEAIVAYGVGTPRVVAELEAEKRLLRDLAALPDVEARTHAPRRARERAKHFDSAAPANAKMVEHWDRSLAFPIPRYELDGAHLRDVLAALEGAHVATPPIEVPTLGATDD